MELPRRSPRVSVRPRNPQEGTVPITQRPGMNISVEGRGNQGGLTPGESSSNSGGMYDICQRPAESYRSKGGPTPGEASSNPSGMYNICERPGVLSLP